MRAFKFAAIFVIAGFFCAFFSQPGIAANVAVVRELETGQRIVTAVSEDATSPQAGKEKVFSTSMKPEFVPGDVIVVYRSSPDGLRKAQTGTLSTSELKAETAKLNALAQQKGVSIIKTYPALSRKSGKVFALLHSNSKAETALLRELETSSGIIGATLNYKTHAFGVPNDPMYGQLWGIPAIQTEKLWDEGLTGSSEVYVAVLDTGVSYTHEDIAANFETSGYSKNFSTSDPSDYEDRFGHGTHVAGTIAGVGNNGKGVAGVNWKAKIIALKVLDDSGNGQWDWTIDALNYLCELVDEHPNMNLAAINLSLGGYMPYSPAEMIKNNNPMWVAFSAFGKKNRAVICVAAGNEGLEVGKPAPDDNWWMGYNKGDYCYPASFQQVDNMIVVANAQNDSEYTRNSGSNYSTTYVDVSAPGTDVLSTVPGNGYDTYSGTSMATPHVAGAAALLKSVFPDAYADQIKDAILEGANKNFAMDYTANGFLDVKAAMNFLAESVNPDSPPSILTSSLPKGMITQPYSATLSASGTKPIKWSKKSGSLPNGIKLSSDGKLTGTPTKAGSYTFTVKAENANGSKTKKLTIVISNGIPEITSGIMKNGSIQEIYSDKLSAQGLEPVTWSVSSGDLPPYLTLSSDGTISGAPSKTGTYTFSVTAQNKIGSSTKDVTITIKGIKPMILNLRYLPSATLGKAYKKQLEAIGTGPVTWTVTDGTLPPGLKLNKSSGLISGTPKKAGYYSFSVKAVNKEGSTSEWFYMYVDDMTTSSDITILTESLPHCSGGIPYVAQLEASGTSPIEWTLEDEYSLPEGLTLNKDGIISGVYKGSWGSYTFIKVKASNSTGSVSKHLVLLYSDSYPSEQKIITESLPYAVTGQEYYAYIDMIGWYSRIFDIAKGELPPGMILDNNGYIRGIPIKAGKYKFTVRGAWWGSACDMYDKKEFTLVVQNKPVKPTIKTTTLPDGKVGVPYDKALSFTGSDIWFSTSGTLPPGLYEYGNGRFTGTPTQKGEYSFTVTANNNTGSDTKNLKITIKGIEPVITTSTFDDIAKGAYYDFALKAMGTPSITWKLESGKLPTGMKLSKAGRITGTPSKTGTFNFKVKASNADGSDTKDFTMKVAANALPIIKTEMLPVAITNIPYKTQLEAFSKGTVKWSIVESGGWLEGLSLDETGVLSGIPEHNTWEYTRSITYLTVKAENSKGSVTKRYEFEIHNENLLPDEFKNCFWSRSGSYPYNGFIVGEKYDLGFYGKEMLAGGSKTIESLKVVSGDFIPGLTIDNVTNSVFITGTPTKAGTYRFTLRGESGQAYEERDYTVTVALSAKDYRPVIIAGTLPDGAVGQTYYYNFTKNAAKIHDTSLTWTIVSGDFPPGFNWIYQGYEGSYFNDTPTKAGTYKFTLQAENSAGKDTKEVTLKITESSVKPSVTTKTLYTGAIGKPYAAVLEAGGTHSYYSNANRWGIKSGNLPDGLMMTSEGKIMGIPTKNGSYTFTVLVKNTWGTATKKLTIKIGDYEKPAITTASLPNATMGKSYSKKLAATGTPSASWTIINGALPAGMKLSSAGKISGTPAKPGTFSFTVKAANSAGQDFMKFTLTVKGTAPKFKTDAVLPGGELGRQYRFSFDVSGTKPVTWTKTGGSLPKGLDFDTKAGVISGTPTKKGTYKFTLKASNGAGYHSKTFTLKISDPLNVTGTFKSPGYLNVAYTSSVTVSGGASPYTAGLASGSLPKGLNLSVSGNQITLSGKPTKTGTYKFKVKVTDSSGRNYTTNQFTVKITGPAISGTLGNGTLNAKYTGTLTASGGTKPYTWTKSSGTLPTGLKLNKSTGIISGTPTKAGKFKFTVKVTDKNKAYTTKSYTITINEASSSSNAYRHHESMYENENQDAGLINENEKLLPYEQTVTINENSGAAGENSSYMHTELYVASEDVLSQGEDRDSDLVIVRANEPLKFVIGTWPREVSYESVYVNDEAVEGIEIEDGKFTLPAEFVHDDFKVSVKAKAGDSELESEELYISAEE